jgi:hypothetical protein
MAISGLQVINIGLQNESTGSDSLYTAFNKTKTNFATLFANASPFNTFTGNTGISVSANSTLGTVDITNIGVTYLQAGTGITLSGNTGNITISSTGGGGGGGGTVTSVGVLTGSASRITVSGSPIVSSGNITLDLAATGVTAGTYTYPTLTVDAYGRLTSVANGASTGTVTSIGITPGFGIQVTGSPITTSGNITVLNTGVTRLNAGTGISLSGSNGNVTISTAAGSGTVTSVGVSSSTLTVSGSPVVSAGIITLDLPSSISLAGNVTVSGDLILNGSEDLAPSGAANLDVTASYFSTSGAETATLAAGTNGQVKTFMMVADGGDMVITVTNAGWKTSGTGTITFDTIGDSCILQYIASKWFVVGNNGCTFA